MSKLNKDAFYFPHFSNARNDAKIIKLRRILGIEGYGIYFMLLEVLRDQTEFKFPLNGIEDLAFEWHVSKEKVSAVVLEFSLFDIDEENNFFSMRFNEYLEPYIKMKLQRVEAGKKSAQKRLEKSTAVQQPFNDRSTTVQQSKVKESKVKESKVKESKLNESKVNDCAIAIVENQLISFEEFWQAYPRKEQKKKAQEKFKRMKFTDRDVENIIAWVQHYNSYEESRKQFIPHAITFLNGERYNDEIPKTIKPLNEQSDYEKHDVAGKLERLNQYFDANAFA
jgi:uncharacterized protein YdaU (DUF1376 family)